MSRSDLRSLVEETPAPELPQLIGELEAARAAAWARLTAPAADKPSDVAGHEARNLDIAQAAKRLGISRDWLYRHASELPFALRIGRRLVFDSVALERWNRRHAER
jgi:predicted DNA-binding transcriptional regulator AlpA